MAGIMIEEGAPVVQPGIPFQDPKVLPAIKVPAEVLAGLTPARAEAAKAPYRAAGYSEEALSAAFPVAKDAAPATANGQGVILPKDELAKSYQLLADKGTIPLEVIAREAAKQGIQIKGRDGQFVAAAGADYKAPDYKFDLTGLLHDQSPEEVASFNVVAAQASAKLGLTQNVAQAAIRSFVSTANAVPDDADEETMARQFEMEGRTINNLKDSAEIIRLAKVGDAALKAAAPDFYEALNENWAFHSAASQLALYQIGLAVEAAKAKH